MTCTRPKQIVPACQCRIERRIAETRTLTGKQISFRSGNTRPRVTRFVKHAFLGTTISPQQYRHRAHRLSEAESLCMGQKKGQYGKHIDQYIQNQMFQRNE